MFPNYWYTYSSTTCSTFGHSELWCCYLSSFYALCLSFMHLGTPLVQLVIDEIVLGSKYFKHFFLFFSTSYLMLLVIFLATLCIDHHLSFQSTRSFTQYNPQMNHEPHYSTYTYKFHWHIFASCLPNILFPMMYPHLHQWLSFPS